MGILNANFNDYKQYARKIKNEYEPLVKDKYSERRMEFLQKALKEKLHFSFEPKNLRSNLEWELTCLEHDDLWLEMNQIVSKDEQCKKTYIIKYK